ncbi:MAG: marine proteobacterial sortase target protein [Pseudomonadales bacterium]
MPKLNTENQTMFRKRSPRYLILEDIAVPQQHVRRWPKLATVAVAVFAVAALSALHAAHANATNELLAQSTVTLDDVEAGQLLFNSEHAGEYRAAITFASEADFQVSGMVAHVTVKQSFLNDSDDWLEGLYVFPLPDDAAINALRIRIGDRIINGEIHERKKAKKIYQQAKRSGRKAALVKQERPNMFTNAIANIAPGETIEVEIKYLQAVSYDAGVFSLRFPMTITPRYIPGQPLTNDDGEHLLTIDGGTGWARNTDQVSDAARITPLLHPQTGNETVKINPIRITGTIDMGMPLHSVDSAYHTITVSRNDNQYSLSLTGNSAPMTQDFVLSWQAEPDSAPQAALFTETLNGENFALLMIAPPQQSLVTGMPKEQTYIIDTSGSMDGVPIRQAKQSLLMALDQLRPQDRFNIIEFNSTTSPFFPQAMAATSGNIRGAKRRVQRLQAQGGTEMLPALNAALKDHADESHLRQIIFITDGAVGNEAALFKLIQQNLGASRLFTVGIGSAPNSYFMRKAAQFGRGSFTHIGDVTEVGVKMSALFGKLNSPVLRQLKIEWPAGIEAENYPQRVPDLYRGEPLLLSMRLNAIPDRVTLSGTSTDEPWHRTLSVNGDASQNNQGVATLWARQKIASLLDEIVAGKDENQVRAQVLPVALTHKLVSPYTSFVAVEQETSRSASESIKTTTVLNAQPKGQATQSYAYPRGATHATQSILWGVLLLMFSAIFQFSIRKEEQYALQA